MNRTMNARGLACACVVVATLLLGSNVIAAQSSVTLERGADALLAIDQHRATVIDRIVSQWGELLAQSDGGLNAEQLRTMLATLRADHLLAASLAGTLEGLRDVLAHTLLATTQD